MATRRRLGVSGSVFVLVFLTSIPGRAQAAYSEQSEVLSTRPPDFNQMRRDQEATDRAWRDASEGVMKMEKITYRSRRGDLDIPAFVFEPLAPGSPARTPGPGLGPRKHPRASLRTLHSLYPGGDRARVSGDRPEYTGSIGYGKKFYDAIDYGGAEVDDVLTAVKVLDVKYPQVDPARIGIVGWSHGGMIALLAATRAPFHIQGSRGDRSGVESFSAPGVEGRPAAPRDRSPESIRRPAV